MSENRGRAKSFSRAKVEHSSQPAGLAASLEGFVPQPVQGSIAGLHIVGHVPAAPMRAQGGPALPGYGEGDAGRRRDFDTMSASSVGSRSSRGTGTSVTSLSSGVQGFSNDRKHGTKGKELQVMTNYVAMEERPNHTIKQYRVDFNPLEDHTYLKKQLLAFHTSKLGSYSFDGAMLYTSLDIPVQHLQLQSAFNNSPVYTITLRYVGDIASDSEPFIQFYNTVFRKCLHLMELEELGRNFYNHRMKISVENAPLELWPGYITAIKRHDHGVLLCIEATHKVLRTTSVLELIKDLIGKNRNMERAHEEIRKEVIGQIVITHYNKKTYRIDDVDFNTTPIAEFTSKGADGSPLEVRYVDYYKNRYSIEIPEHDYHQPLLVSCPRKKDINKGMRTNIYLVPSLCNLTGLSDSHRKDFKLMQRLSDHLHMDPAKRKAKLQDFMDSMKENDAVRKEFQNWDVVFNPQFLKAKARVFGAEEIQVMSKSNTEVFLQYDSLAAADWTNTLKRNHMLQRVELSDWVLYLPHEALKLAPALLAGMREQAVKLGMYVLDPLQIATYDGKMRDLKEYELKKPITDHTGRIRFAVIVLPNNQLQRYTQVKKFFVLKHAIPIQCLLEKNISNRNFGSIMSKMVIQINSKLGGVPWSVRVPFKTRVMILGYDVYHCAERKGESVGALVATTSANLGKYFSVVSFHKDKSELSTNMCLDTKKCLEAFKQANGEYPERILLFRDGVGEGQIRFVVETEVRMMEEGINEVYSAAQIPVPKFTFIVVTKKINSRYMAINSAGQVMNPPPGSVLDDVITIPGRFDFFLVSQSVRQGTVSPTSYNVIYDTSGVSADQIQGLTFKLCHLYFNWSGTVAVPAPCQYAHKLAYLTGVALCHKAPDNLSNVLWYL